MTVKTNLNQAKNEGSTIFCGDNSISQSNSWKFFRLDIFPPSGDPDLITILNPENLIEMQNIVSK